MRVILDTIKTSLRVDGTALDMEIKDLIDSALADLALSGIDVTDPTKPLIKRAVITYCRAHFDYADDSSEKLLNSYNMLKAHLSLSEDYRTVIK